MSFEGNVRPRILTRRLRKIYTSAQLIDRLDQGADVTIGKGKGLSAAWVIRMIRNMVGHHHVRVFDLSIRQHRFDQIDIALVGIHFDEIIALPSDVPEVDIEDFLP